MCQLLRTPRINTQARIKIGITKLPQPSFSDILLRRILHPWLLRWIIKCFYNKVIHRFNSSIHLKIITSICFHIILGRNQLKVGNCKTIWLFYLYFWQVWASMPFHLNLAWIRFATKSDLGKVWRNEFLLVMHPLNWWIICFYSPVMPSNWKVFELIYPIQMFNIVTKRWLVAFFL